MLYRMSCTTRCVLILLSLDGSRGERLDWYDVPHGLQSGFAVCMGKRYNVRHWLIYWGDYGLSMLKLRVESIDLCASTFYYIQNSKSLL